MLGQIVAAAPDDSANWLRLARAVLQIRPANERERTTLLERAATAAYIAYQRTSNRRPRRPTASLIIGRSFADRQVWRPALDALRLSLELREVADVRAQYERMREDHGFRLLDYTVDADAASPRACFQFSEDLPGKRTDFSPFVAVAGQDKPALSAEDKQLCVEGLKHGERYTITLRAGIAVDGARRRWRSPPTSPSMCATASRSCASPARPMCCRAPASAAFRWSASTPRRWRSRSTASATAT